MNGRLPGVEDGGPGVDAASHPDQGAEAALHPAPAHPRGRRGGPGEAARLQGALHRRRRPGLPGPALPGRGRRGHHRHRRLRRGGRVQPAAPGHPPLRPRGPEEDGIGGADHPRAQPGRAGRAPRGDAGPDNVERLIAGYDLIFDGTDTFETRYTLNDAAVRAGIPVVHASVFRFEGQLTVFKPHEGPCYRCLYPTPPPPELAPGCSVAGVLGVVPGVMGLLQATEGSRSCSVSATRWPAGCSSTTPSTARSASCSCGAIPHCPACGDGEPPVPGPVDGVFTFPLHPTTTTMEASA